MKELPPDARSIALNVAADRFTFREDESRRLLLDFVASLPEQEISQPLLDNMQRGLVSQHPEESLAWAAALPGDAAVMATETILSKWASANLERATAAVQTLPDSPARNAARRILEGAALR